MAFEDTDGDEVDADEDATAREDDEDAAPPVSSDEEVTEEQPCDEDEVEDDGAADEADGGAVLVLVLIGIFGLFGLFELLPLEEELFVVVAPLLEELEEAGFMDDPEPGAAAKVGPLFCWPVGAAPTFGAGMF